MSTSAIKNIIFDLGDVLINIDFALTFKAFEKISAKNIDKVYQEFNKNKIWERYEIGEISDQEFLKMVREKLEITVSDKEIINAWNALLLDIPVKRVALLKKLKGKYRTYFLSNTSFYHIEEVNHILQESSGVEDLKKLVEHAYYSHEMKQRKPDPEIYKTVLNNHGLKAEETLFLDDNEANIVSAKTLGIQTILVLKTKDICEYLKDF